MLELTQSQFVSLAFAQCIRATPLRTNTENFSLANYTLEITVAHE